MDNNVVLSKMSFNENNNHNNNNSLVNVDKLFHTNSNPAVNITPTNNSYNTNNNKNNNIDQNETNQNYENNFQITHYNNNNNNNNNNNVNLSSSENLNSIIRPLSATRTSFKKQIEIQTNEKTDEAIITTVSVSKDNNSEQHSSTKKNKNFINKIHRIANSDGSLSVSPLDPAILPSSEDYISANTIATKLYTNQTLDNSKKTQLQSSSVTAMVNINSNNNSNNNNTNNTTLQQQQRQIIMNNPMANHSNKNAYPILKPDSKDELQTKLNNTGANKITTENELANNRSNHTNNGNGNGIGNHVENNTEKTKSKPIAVESRIVFLKVGQIDTRNERYDAEAYIECSWHDDAMFKLLTQAHNANDNHRMIHVNQNNYNTNIASINTLRSILKNINSFEYDPNQHWSPQLYIENAIGDLKEEVRHKLEIVEKVNTADKNMKVTPENVSKYVSNFTVRVCEMRKLRGVFYERLELNDFPMDIQELSITLTSKKSNQDVEIVENKENPCSINTEDFLDQQEWDLFSCVKTTSKTINDPWRKYDRSGFSVTAFIARKPGYYLYNAYMLIFLITVLGFVPFAFDPAAPQFRAQVTGLLLLTSVNFRWIVTQRLPSVPYLTSLDKYAIGSLLFLVCFCVWHSLIGSSIITTTDKKNIDTYVLYGLAGLFLVYNLVYVIWFIKMDRTIKNFKEKCQLQHNIDTTNAKDAKQDPAYNVNNKNLLLNEGVNGNNLNLDTINANNSQTNANRVQNVTLSNGAIIANVNTNISSGQQRYKPQRQTPVHDTTLLMTSA